jgi:hypothetical protein
MEQNITPAAGTPPKWKRVRIPIWTTIGESFRFATQNFRLFFLIALAGIGLQAFVALIPVQRFPFLATATIPFSLAAVFFSLWSGVAIIKAMAKVYYKEPTDFKDSFGSSIGKIWPYILNNILMFFVVFFGILFFLIPGIYYSVIYSLLPMAVVIEDHEKISPFKMSAALIKRYFWTVVLYGLAMLVMMVPVFIICIAPFFFGLFAAMKSPDAIRSFANNPLFLVPAYAVQALLMPYFQSLNFMIYAKLKEAKQGSKALSDPEKLKPRLNGCITVIILAILTFALAITMYLLVKGHIPQK